MIDGGWVGSSLLLEAEPMAFCILLASNQGLLHEIARIKGIASFQLLQNGREAMTVPGGRGEVAGTSLVGFSFIPASL